MDSLVLTNSVVVTVEMFNDIYQKEDLYNYSSRVAMNIVHNWDDANDAASDAYVKVQRKVGEDPYYFRETGKIVPTVCMTARNCALDILRAKKRHKNIPLDELIETNIVAQKPSLLTDNHTDSDLLTTSTAVKVCLEEMPEDQAFPLWLFYYHGHSAIEVSRILGVTVPSMKAKVHRGKTRLRREVGR